MSIAVDIILIILIVIIMSLAHERDIYNSCAEKGHSGSAMWTKSIKCEPKDKPHETGEGS